MLAAILGHIGKLDTSTYAMELAKNREAIQSVAANGEEARDRLNRLVIEEECRAYIKSKAEALTLNIGEIYVEARWSTEGLWVPHTSRIQVSSREEASRLSAVLFGELGIPPEEQEWIVDDGR